MKRKIRSGILASVGLLILILDTKTALAGASEGLQLCIRTIIPSLLPFFVLSILLTSMLTGKHITFLRPLGRLCGIANGAESLLLVGMLGGYPAGAQCVAQAYHSGTLSKQQAQRMIAFCNLAGPAFLFGIVAGKFSNGSTPWLLWAIHIVSALFVATLLPGKSKNQAALWQSKPLSLSDALQQSLRIMASVCGWIILFRIIVAFLNRWFLWLLPVPMQVILTGVLELSNGCCALDRISNEDLRFVVCSGMLAFGGACVTMQTTSVAKGLPQRTYRIGKLLQVLISVLLSALLKERAHIPMLFWIISPVCIALIVKILHKKQKNSSISRLVGV